MALNPSQLKLFADFIEKEIGMMFSEQNYYQLEMRLEKIADLMKMKDTMALYEIASRGIVGDLKNHLLDIATNNETLFFRDPKIYNALEKQILPLLATNRPHALSYKIWSCACSTGQEPYSISMMVDEFSQKTPGHPQIEIEASDFSHTVLTKAQTGSYSQLEVQRGLSAAKLVQYFDKNTKDQWEIKSHVKKRVKFTHFNLLESFVKFGLFDIIFCRYVLIYQSGESKKEIISRLSKQLQPKGYLVLGGSESLFGLSEEFNQINFEGSVFYQKK